MNFTRSTLTREERRATIQYAADRMRRVMPQYVTTSRHLTRTTARLHAAILRRKHPGSVFHVRWVRNSRFHWHVIEIPRDDA